MMPDYALEEHTDRHYVSVMEFPDEKVFVAEAFIRDKGFVWHAVLRYSREPKLSEVIRDTYLMKCKSPRPYRAGQACDGSITAPVFHLYDQLCARFNFDPVETYLEAYDDHILTAEQLGAIIAFADWQGVERIGEMDARVIERILESIREVNMHQLANLLEEMLPF
jgi:hypothetical protein